MNLPTWFNCPLFPEVHVEKCFESHMSGYIYHCIEGKVQMHVPFEIADHRATDWLAREMKCACIEHCKADGKDLGFLGVMQDE